MSLSVSAVMERARGVLVEIVALVAVLGVVDVAADVGSARAAETIYACGTTSVNAVFMHAAQPNLGTKQDCPAHSGLTPGGLEINPGPAATVAGTRTTWTAVAPSGLTIRHATATNMTITQVAGSTYGGGFFWRPLAGGAQDGARFYNGETTADFGISKGTAGFPTQDFGFQLVCGAARCPAGGTSAAVGGMVLTVGETTRPSLSASGVWLQNRWIRGTWPLAVASDSPAGVCSLTASLAGQPVGSSSSAPNQTVWHQCASVPLETTVHTGAFANGAGSLSVTANDAAGEWNSANHVLYIDNSTPAVSLSAPNDPDLNLWVNHAVTVKAAATSGPSGLSAFNCAVDGKAVRYRSPGLMVKGDGTHKVVCNAAGGAIDPNGNHNVGTASENVKIDEAPPAIQFAAVNPADPTALAVRTTDPESGVAGGSITMQGPHAKTSTPLPAAMSGSELLSRFNDGGKNGNYTFTATACDKVGNCGSTQETLHFPVRLRSNGLVSFSKIRTPAKTVRRRVRVGFHYKTVRKRERVGYRLKAVHRRRHGKLVTKEIKVGGHLKRVERRTKVGGHFKRVKVVIHADRRCGHRRVKTGRHRWRELSVCRVMKLRVVSHRRVRFGHKAQLHGLLMTAQGAPIANAPVDIMTRPNDRGGIYRLAATATTDASGRWAAKISGGPSRAIRAYYPGSADVEPVTAHAKVIVPAKITLHITPYVLPWSHTMHIRGHLAGRYHPHDGVALRLLVRYPHTHQWTPLQALRTNRLGGFHFSWSYHAGRGVATYPFKIATTSNETDYPYAANASPAFKVTFGKRTPRGGGEHRSHHKRRDHRPR